MDEREQDAQIAGLDHRLAVVEKVVIGDPADPHSKGVVQMMARIDGGIDALCGVAKALGIGATIGSMVFPIGKGLGWW